ncbi:LLM class flavin-dependent oxidoreductase [Aquincola sp. S2]|uniref:LLM class flavin-dependent oxidoreductase n=1 Tax=Pseudaquabacterium terrae TaxID=2732868 RepID=A0ABX2EPG1_9BURK|nr:LLM class flavin-dependent oxidoreductase [Aquabacterium terrae]NRF70590.1 LLM class flavin-dependent oxidoreductase [Aquabacterium terrae]
MKFGLFGGARVSEEGSRSDSQGYAGFVNYVVEAERLGFASMFLVEHHFTGIGQVSSSLSLLSYLAAKTSTIRLGTGVVVLPWHNPVLVAEQAATLDLLSNGRFDFGVGRGYRKSEFDSFGIPMDEAAERFEEAIEVIRKSFVSRTRFSHHGKRWNYENIVVEPPVKQRPHPPLWIGAGNLEVIRRGARDGFNLLLDQVAPVALIGERVAAFRDECVRIGRAYTPDMVGVTRGYYLARTPEQRSEQKARREQILGSIGGIRQTGAPLPPPEEDDAPLFGSCAEIIERLRALERVGVGYVLVSDPSGDLEALKVFADEVMPAMRTGAAAARAAVEVDSAHQPA